MIVLGELDILIALIELPFSISSDLQVIQSNSSGISTEPCAGMIMISVGTSSSSSLRSSKMAQVV